MTNELKVDVDVNFKLPLTTEDAVSLWLSIHEKHLHEAFAPKPQPCRVCELFHALTVRLQMDAMIVTINDRKGEIKT